VAFLDAINLLKMALFQYMATSMPSLYFVNIVFYEYLVPSIFNTIFSLVDLRSM
jgi:hypothetical protein